MPGKRCRAMLPRACARRAQRARTASAAQSGGQYRKSASAEYYSRNSTEGSKVFPVMASAPMPLQKAAQGRVTAKRRGRWLPTTRARRPPGRAPPSPARICACWRRPHTFLGTPAAAQRAESSVQDGGRYSARSIKAWPAAGVAEKNTDLAILDPSGGAAVMAWHADGVAALLDPS